MDLSAGLARTLLDLAPDPTVIVDSGGVIVFVNAQVENAFGYAPAELVGQRVEILLPERFKHTHPQHRERFAAHAKPRPMGAGGTLFGRHRLGHEFPVEISLSPVTTNEGTLVVAAVRDATVHRDKEDQLIAANRQKTRFLSAASHDLRQPLQTLNLLNRAAKNQVAQPDRMLTLLERQQVALDSMSALLASVLDISKLDSGGVTANPTVTEIDDVLDRVRSDFEPQATEKGLKLFIEHSQEGALTDPEIFRRLIGNLVSNAIRYTQSGEVRVACVRRGDMLSIEVRDTGIGIAADQLDRIFEEFYQVDRGTERPEGLGLGLSIVRRLQQLIGCGVEVESAVGNGTTFRVTIPRIEPVRTTASEDAEQATVTGGRVLVIDDEKPVADATSMLLELEGFEVAVASSVDEALACVHLRIPDVIVSDFRLRGGETGVGIVSAVRNSLGKSIPVIFVTGDTSRSAIETSRIGNANVLSKPVRGDDLLHAVRDRLATQAASAR